MKAAARRTIGKRFKGQLGKAGFAVGVSQNRIRKAQAKHSKAGSAGVGISAANIHWAVLGTKERKSTTTGASRGKMPAVLAGAIQSAAASAGPAILKAAQTKVAQVLAREALKKG
jgi:hypothetical protein